MGLEFFIEQHKPLSTLRIVKLFGPSVDIHEAVILMPLQLQLTQGSGILNETSLFHVADTGRKSQRLNLTQTW